MYRSDPSAHLAHLPGRDLAFPPAGGDGDADRRDIHPVFAAFDQFLDRMPGWIFHAFGAVTALTVLWFTLAFLGGLPAGIVQWIALGMAGVFAYAVGFMVALVIAYLIDTAARLSMFVALAGGATLLGSLGLATLG